MSEETKRPAKKAKKKPIKYVKDPQAPKRFKSAFIFFTMDRHRILREKFEESRGKGDNTPDVAKLISGEWKALEPEERAKWDEKARLDKERYEVEKALYTGPWKIPAKKKSKKDSSAPKRPMSSFLSFSNSKRGQVKEANPGITNAQASKILSRMWKEATEEEKRGHVEREEELRAVYKKEMAEWRSKKEQEETKVREKREEEAMDVVTGKKAFPQDRIALYTGTAFAAAKKANEEHLKANAAAAAAAAGQTKTIDNYNDGHQDGDNTHQLPPPITPNQAITTTAAASSVAHQQYYAQQQLYGHPHFPYQPRAMVTPHSAQASRSSAATTAVAAAAAAASSAGHQPATGYVYPGYNYGPTTGAYYAHHYPHASPYANYPPQYPAQHEERKEEDTKPPAK